MEIKLLLSLMFLSGCSLNDDNSCHYYGNILFTSGSLVLRFRLITKSDANQWYASRGGGGGESICAV